MEDPQEKYELPFILFQTKDNQQNIELLHDQENGGETLYIQTEYKFNLMGDIDIFLENKLDFLQN